MRCLRLPALTLGAALATSGCVEALDQTPGLFSRSGTTLSVLVDQSAATVQTVRARIYTSNQLLTMTPGSGGTYSVAYTPPGCADFVTLRYEITYDDNNDGGTTKVRYEPADGFYYKRIYGAKPPGCPQSRQFQVNRTQDVVDQNIGDGICYAGAPAYGCTLRAAVQEANSDSTPDSIAVAMGDYYIGLNGDDDHAAVGDLDLRYDVLITGAGRGLTRIFSNQTDNIFHVGAGGRSYVDVTIRNLTVDGTQDAVPVKNEGALRLEELVIRNGWSDNSGGGCIQSEAFLDMERVEVHGCYATLGPGGGLLITAGQARVRKSTFHDNGAAQHGAGIAVIGTGTLTLEDSTLYANRANVYGGGLFVNYDLDANVRNCTIYDNEAFTGGSRGEGGGIYAAAFSGELRISNTLVAQNLRRGVLNSDSSDCYGTFTSFGGNLIGIGISDDCTVDDTYSGGDDLLGETYFNIDPRLSGPTGWPQAFTPDATSPALSAASAGAPNQAHLVQCTRKDQFGRDRTTMGACDVGAVQRP